MDPNRPTTRAEIRQKAYKHLIEEILDMEENDPIPSALARDKAESIPDIIALTESDLATLKYKTTDPKGKEITQSLAKGEQRLLAIIPSFVLYKRSQGIKLSEENWLDITPTEFQDYRTSPDFIDIRMGNVAPLTVTAAPTNAPTNPRPRDPIADFKRGIKRDPAQFATLKDEKQWDAWNQDTRAQARAQDVMEVLTPTYSPSTPQEIALFDEKKKFMYAVFMKTVQTDMGKSYVRSNEHNYDAQKVYANLLDHASKSTKAAMDSSAIMTYITSVRLGDGKWRGTTNGFILNWVNQVRKYEAIVPHTDHLSDAVKRTMLENAVAHITDLRAVKAQADQHRTHTGNNLSFEQYMTLLTSAAITYDATFATKTNKKGMSRQVYNAQFDDHPYELEQHNIDSDITDFDLDPEIYEINQAHRNPRLSLGQWNRLSNEAQTTWDMLDEASKHIILENRYHTTRQTNPNNRQGQSVNTNLHALTNHDTITTNVHDVHIGGDPNPNTGHSNENNMLTNDSTDDTNLIDQIANSKISAYNAKLPPGNVNRLLSTKLNKNVRTNATEKDNPNERKEITVDGIKYRQCNVAKTTYHASPHKRKEKGALVDRGCNGGICGSDTRVISASDRTVDVQGIDNHRMSDIRIVQAGAVTRTQRGEVIVIMNQYAYSASAKTIHSSTQMEAYRADVNDRSAKVPGGKQRIKTLEGYVIPLDIRSGLPYMDIRPFTDHEWNTLPHVVLTSDEVWDPTVLDNGICDDEEWYDAQPDMIDDPTNSLFDEYGNYRHRVACRANTSSSDLEDNLLPTSQLIYEVHERVVKPKEPDYAELQPNFGWVPTDIIKKTYEATTQYARIPMSSLLTRHFKSPFPALNVPRRHEDIATDTVYSDTPAIDSGATQAQFYIGKSTLVADAYGMKTDKQFVNTLLDQIRHRGAPDRLLSDSAQVETSSRVMDIGDWQSEPMQQQQNPAERHYQTVKRMTNTVMDRTNSPSYTWLLALLYVCFLLNHLAHAKLNHRTPLEALTGSTPDISPLLRFHWWEEVYYKIDDSDFPSDSLEKKGRFVGIAENVGHAMTFKILTNDTKRIITRANVRSAGNPLAPNLRADLFDSKSGYKEFVRSVRESDEASLKDLDTGDSDTERQPQLMVIKPEDLIGRTFLKDPMEDGQRHRARIVEAIDDHQHGVINDPRYIKFRCTVNDEQYEEVVAYNDIIQHIEKEEDEDTTVWKYKRINAHQGPLATNHPDYKGSKYNVMLEWENGEVTAEPLTTIAADDPVTCAIYAREKGLLDTDGWKRFKHIAKRQKKLFRMANQAKLRSYRTAPRYMYGFEIPRDYHHAIELDRRNGTDRWKVSTMLEMTQHQEYDTFHDKGRNPQLPDEYKKIRVHLIYAVKHDGRHKARLVADGHLTDTPVDSVYSGVVSLRGLRMLIFLAELNHLQTWATDVGNAYLEARTSEKVYIIAGPEFGEAQGNTMVIHKALYGLRTSGLRWHERFAAILKKEGFNPCVAEPDIWMRRNDDIYEYVAVYVDDLAIVMKDPEEFVKALQDTHKLKLKGTGEIEFHLGCDFYRDDEGVLCMQPRKYIDKMIDGYERMFGTKPKHTVMSPLEKGDHPEIDDSELLDPDGIQKYQSLIGSAQWAVSLGRFDVATAVMTLSSFRAAPRKGHLERAKRMVAYLSKMRHAVIRFRVDLPDLSDLDSIVYDWEHTVYGNVNEATPHNAPEPLGKEVILVHYVDANLMHDLLTGRSVTGILHFINQTPIDWFSKKQATVETATYGSEFIAARTATEQIIELRTTLRYLGVKIQGKSILFGDNESVTVSSTKIDAKLHKRHSMLSFHRVREAVAAKVLAFFHLPGVLNPADVLSKHWGYAQVWRLLRPILFWKGDTADIPNGTPVDEGTDKK